MTDDRNRVDTNGLFGMPLGGPANPNWVLPQEPLHIADAVGRIVTAHYVDPTCIGAGSETPLTGFDGRYDMTFPVDPTPVPPSAPLPPNAQYAAPIAVFTTAEGHMVSGWEALAPIEHELDVRRAEQRAAESVHPPYLLHDYS